MIYIVYRYSVETLHKHEDQADKSEALMYQGYL